MRGYRAAMIPAYNPRGSVGTKICVPRETIAKNYDEIGIFRDKYFE